MCAIPLTLSYFVVQICLYKMKIAYHCFSCKQDFTDIETAKEHSKSLCHEVSEEVREASEEGKFLLV
jgi:hypothetical protein